MEWSQRRKTLYKVGVVLIVIAISAYPVYKAIHKDPTCFDTKQNGVEKGVDCGGACAFLCAVDIKSPRVVWAKAFPTNGDVYDVGAYVENLNLHAGLRSANYTISVRDSKSEILSEIKGTIELAPMSPSLIFETGITFPGVPSSVAVTFDPENATKWMNATTEATPVATKNKKLKNADTKPRFDATLVNTDLVNEIRDLTIGAVIYDAHRNPVAVSKTYVNRIPRGEEQNIFFTWPDKFTKQTVAEKICTTPVDTMLVFDRSGSMDIGQKNPPEPLTTAKNAANAYVKLAKSVDKVGLVTFANTASVPIDHNLSLNHQSVSATLMSLAIGTDGLQNTNIGDGLKTAMAEFQSIRHDYNAKSVMVILTDGDPNRPVDPANKNNDLYAQEYAANAAGEVRKSGVELYAIGLGSNINEDFLRDRISGNKDHYFNALTVESLSAIYKTISEVVCPPENFITELVITPKAIFAN